MTTRHAGFTLVELMVTIAVATIVVGGAVLLTITQSQFHQSQWQQMESVHALRRAMGHLKQHVPLAGFGVPRHLAFDLAFTDDGGGCIDTDRISVRYRDPIGEWSTDAINVGVNGAVLAAGDLPTDSALDPGWPLRQALMIYDSAVHTLIDVVQPRSTGGTAFTLLAPNNGLLDLTSDRISFYRVHTLTFYIDCSADPTTPYLMLDQGIDTNGDGAYDADDVIPLAANISNLQVRYYVDLNGNGLLDDPQVNGLDNPITASDLGVDPLAWVNIKAVEVTITSRKARQQVLAGDASGKEVGYSTQSLTELFVLRNLNTTLGPVDANLINTYQHVPNQALRM